MSEYIVQSRSTPETDGNMVTVTPESAGWKYVGFQVYLLEPGQSYRNDTGNREICIVLLAGSANIATSRQQWKGVGGRASVFEQIPPYSVYVPSHDFVEVEAVTHLEFAVCSAPGKGTYEARLIRPEHVGVEMRGHGNMERRIHNILPEMEQADSLLVVEVFTPGGHWSSYPPHKHDRDALPDESLLEETYYYKVNPGHGFAVQRIYSDDRSLNEAVVPGNGDVVLVPRGYHPVSAPPGYDVYYLNVMAGPVRTWKFHNDPQHDWLFKARGQ